jgi:predicted nucleic acid-binding protein
VLLLDTSFLIDLESELSSRRLGSARRLLEARALEPVGISIVSVGEFAQGFEDVRSVEAFLAPFRVIQLSRAIAYRMAALQASLAQRLGENDAWIAATALAYHASLVGREKAFARVPRLQYLRI